MRFFIFRKYYRKIILRVACFKIFPKYLDFENISNKCIRVPGPYGRKTFHVYRKRIFQILFKEDHVINI